MKTTARIGGASLLEVGTIVASRYRIDRFVCEGGMGCIYEARHERLGQRVAIKVLRPDLAQSDDVVLRFDREARAAARLQTIHCARVIDVSALPDGLPFIVFEYLEGHDLGRELSSHGPLPPALAVDYVLQAATAMVEAHALGIIHRDLKPSNLFLCRISSTSRRLVKVLDFGVSKIADGNEPRITGDSEAIGTPAYMSPEQVRGSPELDGRSDVWSLGVILFELLTGRTPFVGSPTSIVAQIVEDPVPAPSRYRDGLPAGLVRVVMRMLAKDSTRRVQSMAEASELLAPFAPRRSDGSLPAEAPHAGARLGEILIAQGALTAEALDRALARQRTTGQLLGAVLTDMRLVSRDDILAALARQQGLRDPADPMGWPTVPAAAGVRRRRALGAYTLMASIALAASVAMLGACTRSLRAATPAAAAAAVVPVRE